MKWLTNEKILNLSGNQECKFRVKWFKFGQNKSDNTKSWWESRAIGTFMHYWQRMGREKKLVNTLGKFTLLSKFEISHALGYSNFSLKYGVYRRSYPIVLGDQLLKECSEQPCSI